MVIIYVDAFCVDWLPGAGLGPVHLPAHCPQQCPRVLHVIASLRQVKTQVNPTPVVFGRDHWRCHQTNVVKLTLLLEHVCTGLELKELHLYGLESEALMLGILQVQLTQLMALICWLDGRFRAICRA